jgi:ribosomal protein S8
MIHVLIIYKNNVSDRRAVKNDEVASKYVDAIINVFKHENIIDEIEKIETIDYLTKEYKIVYPEVTS